MEKRLLVRRGHKDRLRELAGTMLRRGLLPMRRHIVTAAALSLVVFSTLLSLNEVLPFPLPGERMLYDPTDWSLLFGAPRQAAVHPAAGTAAGQSMGGLSVIQPPVVYLLYRAHPGDTMGNIASHLGVSMDTLASMNRVQGQGVHNVMVGELLKVPSQDGIPAVLSGDFDAFCQKNSVAPDAVLSANGVSRADLHDGMVLFLPGVQHTGFQLALYTGTLVAMPLHGYESSPFGYRADPFTGLPNHHTGVDIAAPMGSQIRSATDGTVIRAEFDNMLGNYVQVQAYAGFSYIYGHMSKILAGVGVRVHQGQVIGLVGETGYATGPHLHFEVRKNGVPQNPRSFLPGIR